MVDKGGWRKKIQASRPRTPVQPNAATASNVDGGGTIVTTGFVSAVAPAESVEGRRSQPAEKSGWRKTFHGTRPSTPVLAPSTAAEDTESEHGHEATPRRLKPKLSRYLSNYLSLTNPPKAPDFSEPWSEDSPPAWVTPVDPLIVLQSVHSYLLNHPAQPLPVQHNSGILVIFEHYRKLREQKERLEGQMEEVLKAYQTAEQIWTSEEDRFQEEIRRLELIIARGTSGMSGLMKARQGSVVDRKSKTKRTVSTDRLQTAYEHLTAEQLDEQIMSLSQNILLQRSTSPSGGMAALSRRFSGSYSEDVKVGGPSRRGNQATLARKVRSELDLAGMGDLSLSPSTAKSVVSEFSEAGDPLPDEVDPSNTTALDGRVEGEAYVALKELAGVVARKKGMDVAKFHSKLMALFSEEDESGFEQQSSGKHARPSATRAPESWLKTTPRSTIPSQVQLRVGTTRQRHFSFEPGDDQLAELNRRMSKAVSPQSTPLSEAYGNPALSVVQNEQSASTHQPLEPDTQRQSKIPSPVMTMGRGRREESSSSLQGSPRPARYRSRRTSTASVLTAYHVEQQGTTRKQTSTESRSSSISNLREEGGSLRDRPSTAQRNIPNFAVLAATRAADRATSSGGSDSKVNSVSATTGANIALLMDSPRHRTAARKASENDNPSQCT